MVGSLAECFHGGCKVDLAENPIAIRTRGLANHVFVDLSIHGEPTWAVEQGHVLATKVEAFLLTHFDSVEDVVVHIEPEGHSTMELTESVPITSYTPEEK